MDVNANVYNVMNCGVGMMQPPPCCTNRLAPATYKLVKRDPRLGWMSWRFLIYSTSSTS
jgi:hypothetical protein